MMRKYDCQQPRVQTTLGSPVLCRVVKLQLKVVSWCRPMGMPCVVLVFYLSRWEYSCQRLLSSPAVSLELGFRSPFCGKVYTSVLFT